MAQILTGPTMAQMSAQRIGDPVMQSLQNLTNMQLQSIDQQKQRSNTMAGLSALMPQKQAEAMSYLPPEVLRSIMPGMMRNKQLSDKVERIEQAAIRQQALQQQQIKQYQDQQQGVQPQQDQPQQNINPVDMIQQLTGGGAPISNQDILRNALGGMPPQQPQQPQQPSQYEQDMQRQEVQRQEERAKRLAQRKREETKKADPRFDYDKNYIESLIKYGDSKEAHDVTKSKHKEFLAERKMERSERGRTTEYQRKRFNDKWDRFDEQFEKDIAVERKNRERIVGYRMSMNYVKTGKAQLGFQAFAKEKLKIQNFTENTVTQVLRKALAKEPLEFVMTIAKEGGATAVKSKAMLDQIQEATGKMRNDKDGLVGIFKMNKGFLELQRKYVDIKASVAEKYRESGREPSVLIEREISKQMEPHLDKLENVSHEIILKAASDNLDPELKPAFMKRHPVGSIMYDVTTDNSYKVIKDGEFVDFKFVGKGDRTGR